eukprot:6457451-Amphidinium_carterae.1
MSCLRASQQITGKWIVALFSHVPGEKLRTGQDTKTNEDFMIIARLEALIAGRLAEELCIRCGQSHCVFHNVAECRNNCADRVDRLCSPSEHLHTNQQNPWAYEVMTFGFVQRLSRDQPWQPPIQH